MGLHIRSRVVANAATGTVAQAFVLGISLLTTPVILARLGTVEYGAFALITSLTVYFGILDLGIGGSLTRFMAFSHERGDEPRIARFATFGLLFYLMLAALLAPLVWLAAPGIGHFLALPGPVQVRFPVLMLTVLGLFIGWSLTGILVARLAAAHRLDLPAYANIAGSLVFAGLVFSGLPAAATIEGLLGCMACQLLAVLAILAIANRRLHGRLLTGVRHIRWPEMRELFSFGLWTQVAGITAVVNLEADKVIISRSIGVDQVTPYHVANRVALLSRMLPLQLLTSLLPAITAEVSRGEATEQIAELYARTSRSVMVPTLVIVGFVAGGADALLRLWLGTDLPGASVLCVALVVSYAVNNVTGAGTVILKAEGFPQLETFYGILSAVLNIGLTAVLTPRLGLVGVVTGTIVGNVVGSVTFVWLFHRRKRFGWWPTVGRWLAKLVLVTGAGALLTHGALLHLAGSTTSRSRLLIVLLGTGLAYLAFCWLAGQAIALWTKDDRALLDRFARRLWRRSSRDQVEAEPR